MTFCRITGWPFTRHALCWIYIDGSAFCICYRCALTKKYTEWVRPALPWTLFAVVMLGIGIAMGGYWAYETLSFGGYWAWDPVENSSLVPWIIGVAAIHMMIVQKKSGASHKSAAFPSVCWHTFSLSILPS